MGSSNSSDDNSTSDDDNSTSTDDDSSTDDDADDDDCDCSEDEATAVDIVQVITMDFADNYTASDYNSDTDMQDLLCAGYSTAIGIYTIGTGYADDCSCDSEAAAAERRASSLAVTFSTV